MGFGEGGEKNEAEGRLRRDRERPGQHGFEALGEVERKFAWMSLIEQTPQELRESLKGVRGRG